MPALHYKLIFILMRQTRSYVYVMYMYMCLENSALFLFCILNVFVIVFCILYRNVTRSFILKRFVCKH